MESLIIEIPIHELNSMSIKFSNSSFQVGEKCTNSKWALAKIASRGISEVAAAN
jgi:hypothetical protein